MSFKSTLKGLGKQSLKYPPQINQAKKRRHICKTSSKLSRPKKPGVWGSRPYYGQSCSMRIVLRQSWMIRFPMLIPGLMFDRYLKANRMAIHRIHNVTPPIPGFAPMIGNGDEDKKWLPNSWKESNFDSLLANSLDADDSVEARSSLKRDTTKILAFVLKPPLT